MAKTMQTNPPATLNPLKPLNLRERLRNTDKCPECGLSLLIVGKRHQCDRRLIVAMEATTYLHRTPRQRRKYQRELMRQRRAALKAAAAVLPPS
jgi:hypothetical protein